MAMPSSARSYRRRPKESTYSAVPPPPVLVNKHTVFDDDDDLSIPIPVREKPPKRKRGVVDLSDDDDDEAGSSSGRRKKRSRKRSASDVVGEKRLRRWRPRATYEFKTLLERATTQSMFVLSRKRTGAESEPEETLKISGTTGNIYTVKIGKVPECNCPYAARGMKRCKHIVYILSRVLKARVDLQYQVAFLTSELNEIFEHAPPITSENSEDNGGRRKPLGEECPICNFEFDKGGKDVVWCRAACGNNMHSGCLEKWAYSKLSGSCGITCPFCRAPWQEDKDLIQSVDMDGEKNEEGYVNIANQLGISGVRDHSTYHQIWVNRQRRLGLIL